MKRLLRSLLWRVAPRQMAERARRFELGLRESLGISAAARRWVSDHGDRIVGGPFAGMRYPVDLLALADAPVAKMEGLYELELRPAIEAVVEVLRARTPTTFVDLGCADGYYAVGVGRTVAGVTVEAFDLARSAREATRALAEANGVSRINLNRGATAAALYRLAPDTRAVLCDIEGAEMDVLTGEVAGALAHAHVVVELHEGQRPGVERAVVDRFAPTHTARLIDHEPGDRKAVGIGEMRSSAVRWVWLTPRVDTGMSP